MILKFLLLILNFQLAQAYLPGTHGGEQNELPDSIEGVGIDEKLNSSLPASLEFTDDAGKKVTIGSYYNDNKPVIISPVYYSCPSLCNLHLKGVFEVFQNLGLTPGKDFEFLAVSFDPKEEPTVAAAKKETYVSEFLPNANGDGIHFLTGTQENIDKLMKAVGFKFKWSAEANEWAHASAAILATPQGVISRYLHGVYFDPTTFRLSVVETSKGMVGNLKDNFALFCFRYDPKANKYAFYIMNILRGAAALCLLAVCVWLFTFYRKSKRAPV